VVVVTYERPLHPRLLDTLRDQVDWLIVVDNSTSPEPRREIEELCRSSPIPVDLIQNRANLGTAKAFNQGVESARAHGCETVFLLDGDALVESEFYEVARKLLETLEGGREVPVGVVVPIVSDESPSVRPPTVAGSWTPVRSIISSGALFRIALFDQVGGFSEQLFVDGVDFDFARKVRASGRVLARVNRVLVRQPFGQPIPSSSLRVRSLERVYSAFYVFNILLGRSNSFHTRLSHYNLSRRAELVRSVRRSNAPGSDSSGLRNLLQWSGVFATLLVDTLASLDPSYLRLALDPMDLA
jgi:rhamnosyltransferase